MTIAAKDDAVRLAALKALQSAAPPSANALAEELGVSPTTIKRWAKKAGLFLPNKGGRPPKEKHRDE